jgi:outer membrane protein
MKNFTLGLNIVLAVAVAVLFYLHFSSPKTASAGETKTAPAGGFKIAYFEIDSVQEHFEYYKEIKEQLESKAQANTKILNDLKAVLTNKYQDLQRIASALSQAELAKQQQDLMQMENAFKGKEKMLSDEMQAEVFEKMHDVRSKIGDYLKQYNQGKGYAYIFTNMPDLMYYKDSSLYDITPDVLSGLNAVYKKKK